MTTISFKTRQINNFTPISNIFIEKYMPKANATFVKIYIYLYRFFYTNTQTSVPSVASNLSLLESDVVNAIKYWESLGLMSLEEDSKNKSFSINFTNLIDPCIIPSKMNIADDSPIDSADKKIAVKEHNYTPEEIGHILKYNGDIKQFISFIETKFASPLTPKNLKQLISMFDSLNLNVDIYQFLSTYAYGKGITNINAMLSYIEKISVSLCEKGIKTMDEAEKYISQSNKFASNQVAATTESKPSQPKSNNKFMNFDEPAWDFEEIKRSEQEFLEEELKRINEKNKN